MSLGQWIVPFSLQCHGFAQLVVVFLHLARNVDGLLDPVGQVERRGGWENETCVVVSGAFASLNYFPDCLATGDCHRVVGYCTAEHCVADHRCNVD